jgi:hypothetical protein
MGSAQRKIAVGSAVVMAGLGGLQTVPAGAQESPITVIASGLEDPVGIGAYYENLFVAESGAGNVVQVNPTTGDVKVVIAGLTGPSGVARTPHGLAVVTAGAEAPDASTTGDASVFYDFGGIGGDDETLVADLEAYELEHNPDGQLQFDPDSGEPLDALSNPFAMSNIPGSSNDVLVGDGGANDVLRVTAHRQVSTFFVPPQVNTGACEGLPNNDREHPGCDQVVTGVTFGPDGNAYIAAANSLVPDEGIVYVVDPDSGDIVDQIGGFSGPTGVAVDADGNVYVSEVLFGGPPEGEEPPPDFDPSTVGRIVKVTPDGERTAAAVTLPTGLLWFKGKLYASAWSVAGQFLGMHGAGQIVSVADSAFS